MRGWKQERKHQTGGKYIETRARLFASIPPRHKYIRNDVNHQPAIGVKPLFTFAFFSASTRVIAIE
jgi:hypothetical protein